MVRMDAEGTQRGMPAGVGRETRLAFTVTGLIRLIEGKIAVCWVIPDTLAILQQLGEVEPVGEVRSRERGWAARTTTNPSSGASTTR